MDIPPRTTKPPLDATIARHLTAEAIRTHHDISSIITHIDKRIEQAARAGAHHIDRPFAIRRHLSEEEKTLIREHYVTQGFAWATVPEVSISWATFESL